MAIPPTVVRTRLEGRRQSLNSSVVVYFAEHANDLIAEPSSTAVQEDKQMLHTSRVSQTIKGLTRTNPQPFARVGTRIDLRPLPRVRTRANWRPFPLVGLIKGEPERLPSTPIAQVAEHPCGATAAVHRHVRVP